MTLKYIRLNLQEILIVNESGSNHKHCFHPKPDLNEERPVGAIHICNKTIFLKGGGYYSENNGTGRVRSVRQQIQRDLNDIVKPNWKILYSPDSFGLDQWDYETGSHLSLGEISYRHLPKAEKDARNDISETLPEVKPVRLTGFFPEPEEIEESH